MFFSFSCSGPVLAWSLYSSICRVLIPSLFSPSLGPPYSPAVLTLVLLDKGGEDQETISFVCTTRGVSPHSESSRNIL